MLDLCVSPRGVLGLHSAFCNVTHFLDKVERWRRIRPRNEKNRLPPRRLGAPILRGSRVISHNPQCSNPSNTETDTTHPTRVFCGALQGPEIPKQGRQGPSERQTNQVFRRCCSCEWRWRRCKSRRARGYTLYPAPRHANCSVPMHCLTDSGHSLDSVAGHHKGGGVCAGGSCGVVGGSVLLEKARDGACGQRLVLVDNTGR